MILYKNEKFFPSFNTEISRRQLMLKTYIVWSLQCWVFFIAILYARLVNIILIYGLKKTTQKWKKLDLVTLQFLFKKFNVVYYLGMYRRAQKIVLTVTSSLNNVLFLMEMFSFCLLMVFSRYINISYPFQNNFISKYINKNMFAVTMILVNLSIYLHEAFKLWENLIYILYYVTVDLLNLFLCIKKLRKIFERNGPCIRFTEPQ